MTKREIWSLFSGAAGLDIGLEQVGLKPTMAVEIDPSCCATIRKNCPDLDVWETDITKLSADDLMKRRGNPAEVFLMVGGPPCQSFSPGGKRAALSDPRGNLIYTYLSLIDKVRPRFFVLENVAHLVTAALKHRPIADRPGKQWNLSRYANGSPTGDDDVAAMEPDELSGSAIRQVLSDISKLGYSWNFSVVNAADYGAPQHRFRLIILGAVKGNHPAIPAPTHGPASNPFQPHRTLRDAIFDLRENPGPHSEYTPNMARFFSMVPPGGSWRSLPKKLQREALGDAAYAAGGGKTGFFRRLSWDAPSPTVTGRANRKGSALCHPEEVRPLSVRESARLQGFPDDWMFHGSMSDQYMQVGNAVPIHLGHAVGRAIKIAAIGNSNHNGFTHKMDIENLLNVATTKLRATARNKRGKEEGQLLLLEDGRK